MFDMDAIKRIIKRSEGKRIQVIKVEEPCWSVKATHSRKL